MRKSIAAFALLLAGGLATGADAEPKPRTIDASKMRDQLAVYRDDAGHYLVAPRQERDDATDWVFYGDGKTLSQQRVFAHGASDDGMDFSMWSPRVSEQSGAQLTVPAAGGATLSCGPKSEHAFTQLPADQARALVGRATFEAPAWQHTVTFVARDDDGIYYVVDALQDELGGGGQRLFVGKRGALKEVALTHVVSDPAGEVFATKDGSIKTFGADDKPPVWRHGDKVTELTALDRSEPATRLLVYRDFKIYGALGTPCD